MVSGPHAKGCGLRVALSSLKVSTKYGSLSNLSVSLPLLFRSSSHIWIPPATSFRTLPGKAAWWRGILFTFTIIHVIRHYLEHIWHWAGYYYESPRPRALSQLSPCPVARASLEDHVALLLMARVLTITEPIARPMSCPLIRRSLSSQERSHRGFSFYRCRMQKM